MSLEASYPNGRPTWHTGESIAYALDTAKWTLTPTATSVVEVIDESDGSNVKSTVMPSGSTSVANSVITLPLFKLATVGKEYRIEIQFTGDAASVVRTHIRVKALV
jgi:hypothetical protein